MELYLYRFSASSGKCDSTIFPALSNKRPAVSGDPCSWYSWQALWAVSDNSFHCCSSLICKIAWSRLLLVKKCHQCLQKWVSKKWWLLCSREISPSVLVAVGSLVQALFGLLKLLCSFKASGCLRVTVSCQFIVWFPLQQWRLHAIRKGEKKETTAVNQTMHKGHTKE